MSGESGILLEIHNTQATHCKQSKTAPKFRKPGGLLGSKLSADLEKC